MAHFSAGRDGSGSGDVSSDDSSDDSARGIGSDVPTPWWMVPANGVGRRAPGSSEPDSGGQDSSGQDAAGQPSSRLGSADKEMYDESQPRDRIASRVPPLWTDLPGGVSPYVDLDRETWAELAESTPLPLTEDELARLAGLGDPIDLDEVATVYLPLSRLLNLFAAGTGMLHTVTSTFLRERSGRTPFVIGVAGSVAVGKSTSARVLRELLARWPDTPRVELVTTDGFLYPNAVLEERKIMHRKGFPESYDRRALLQFMAEVKSGAPEVSAPKYDHLTYDILEDEQITVHKPDVLIVEGLNVLQPARIEEGRIDSDGSSALAVSDFFDFSIYVDAEPADVENWFVKRFLHLRETAFADPESFFHQFSSLTDEQAVAMATGVWRSINEPNLIENILPTRGRANLVLTKGPDHAVTNVRLRKL